jgi:aryl-alcohol dehydrogenase-like predicted oxidoreductase
MRNIHFNDFNLSKLCLGTVQFGIDYGIANEHGQVAQDEVKAILDFVQHEGINAFDTAQGYGKSEEVLGHYFRSSKDITPQMISKVPSKAFSNPYEALKKEIDSSLNRLAQDRLFALLLHDSALLYSWSEETSAKVEKLQSEGVIHSFGVSIYSDEEFLLAMNNPHITMVQIPFNLFDQRAVHKGWLKVAKSKNKLLFIRSVYLQGLLLMDEDKVPSYLDHVKPFLSQLKHLAKGLNITRNQLALAYVDQVATDSIVLFGCDTLQQAQENIRNYNTLPSLSDHTIETIEQAFASVDETIYNPTKWNKA